jgi:hypothetical protein
MLSSNDALSQWKTNGEANLQVTNGSAKHVSSAVIWEPAGLRPSLDHIQGQKPKTRLTIGMLKGTNAHKNLFRKGEGETTAAMGS